MFWNSAFWNSTFWDSAFWSTTVPLTRSDWYKQRKSVISTSTSTSTRNSIVKWKDYTIFHLKLFVHKNMWPLKKLFYKIFRESFRTVLGRVHKENKTASDPACTPTYHSFINFVVNNSRFLLPDGRTCVNRLSFHFVLRTSLIKN